MDAPKPKIEKREMPTFTSREVRLITRKQLAERWQCDPATIMRRKDLMPLRLGESLIRYSLSQVEDIEAKAAAGSKKG